MTILRKYGKNYLRCDNRNTKGCITEVLVPPDFNFEDFEQLGWTRRVAKWGKMADGTTAYVHFCPECNHASRDIGFDEPHKLPDIAPVPNPVPDPDPQPVPIEPSPVYTKESRHLTTPGCMEVEKIQKIEAALTVGVEFISDTDAGFLVETLWKWMENLLYWEKRAKTAEEAMSLGKTKRGIGQSVRCGRREALEKVKAIRGGTYAKNS